MNQFLKLISTFSEDSSIKGKEFEKLCKWLLENHPLYKPLFKKVWLWDDWPERWGVDAGIDLIAEEYDGKTWAIQAKCYNPSYSIKKADVDSFLSESTNKKIHHRLLISSTDRIGAHAINVIKRQYEILPVNQMMLKDLLEAPLIWPKSINKLTKGKQIKPFTPWPYQKKAINSVVSNLNDRGQLIMACGTGKTYVGLWVHEKLNVNTTLVLFPSLLLLSKTLAVWLAHAKKPFRYLPVCSDESVSKSKDSISLSQSELSFPSTTDPKLIKNFLNEPGKKVIFSTYQSSEKIEQAFQLGRVKPIDLVIADEAHRCAGKTDSSYSIVLDNKKIPAKQRLFMTATPRIFTSQFQKQSAKSGTKVLSMDNVEDFGPELHKLSFGHAIKPPDGSKPLLTDYQVVVVGIDNPYYSSMIDKRKLIRTDNNIQSDAQSFASYIALAKAIKSFDLKKIITFHTKVKAASDFANKFSEVIDWMSNKSRPSGSILTNFVSGKMSTFDRNKKLEVLSDIEDGQRCILSNARCLSEGIDVPTLDGIAFIDPRNSEIDIIQAVGRAIRLSKDKNIGTIVIPVFIDENEDSYEVINSSPFKKVWAVVNALRAHDEDLGEKLDQLRRELGKRGKVGSIDKIIFDLPKTINKKFEIALKTRLIESTSQSWEFWFGLLEEYIATFGHGFIPSDYKTKSNYPLGAWAANQRHYYNIESKYLDNKGKQRLEDLGFIWSRWEFKFNELLKYKKLYGNCNVPDKHITEFEVDLGAWVIRQRAKFKNGTLEREKIKKLNEVSFVWDFKLENFEKGWQRGFSELTNFKDAFGHCRVSHDFVTASNFELGRWVASQRGYNQKGSLDKEKFRKLNKIGFIWNVEDALWSQGFEELLNYKNNFGNCIIKTTYVTKSGFKLGSWATNQRVSYNANRLSDERQKKLNQIGFIWSLFEQRWEAGFNELLKYIEIFGHSNVPSSYVSESKFNLGTWCYYTKIKAQKKKLSDEKIKKLADIDFF